ncbi:MAG: hypothetical protein V3W34_19715, partial [Phycisphaerae bacterium]
MVVWTTCVVIARRGIPNRQSLIVNRQSSMNAVLTNLIAQADRTTVERRFEFAALPQGWGTVLALAGAVVVCWAIVWMYRTEGRRGASMRVRMVLAAVRCVVMLLLAGILLQPVLA